MEIKVEKQPNPEYLEELGVKSWDIWIKQRSEFPWYYDRQEICYFLEGEAIVTPKSGDPVQIAKGNLAIFPAGMSCTWKILKGVKKHYRFD